MRFDWLRALLTAGKQGRDTVLYKGESRYRSHEVIETPARHRLMYAGPRHYVAGMDMKTGLPLYSSYFLAELFVRHPGSLLFLGGGPCVAPIYAWNTYKPSRITIVEHDEDTVRIARQYFYLPNDPAITVRIQDAYAYLKSNTQTFDVIFSDLGITRRRAIRDLASVCDRNGILLQKKALAHDGVLISNVIASGAGADRDFLRAYRRRFLSVFPGCYFFSDDSDHPRRVQLHTLVALNKSTDIHKAYRRYTQAIHAHREVERLFGKLTADDPRLRQ